MPTIDTFPMKIISNYVLHWLVISVLIRLFDKYAQGMKQDNDRLYKLPLWAPGCYEILSLISLVSLGDQYPLVTLMRLWLESCLRRRCCTSGQRLVLGEAIVQADMAYSHETCCFAEASQQWTPNPQVTSTTTRYHAGRITNNCTASNTN